MPDTRGCVNRQFCFASEPVGYLYALMLEAPLLSAWAHVYIWLGQQVFPRWKFPDAGLETVTLSRDEIRQLRDLRS